MALPVKLLLIDNYDSFTFNLVQQIGSLVPDLDIVVVRNDDITTDEALALDPAYLVISPGPCTPKQSGISPDLVTAFRGRIPILGVCLGHQVIAEVLGGDVIRHDRLMHGKTSQVHHDERGIFAGLPTPFTATRYHSLIVQREGLPAELEVSAWTDAGEIMGLRCLDAATPSGDRGLDGVQFHPESFLTEHGKGLMANFLGHGESVQAHPA